jgi:porphobilinogen synthase
MPSFSLEYRIMTNLTPPLIHRPRRLRRTPALRQMLKQVHLDIAQLIQPLFITVGENIRREIKSMPDVFQLSVDNLDEELNSLQAVGISHVLLFGIPAEKDELGSASWCDEGIIQQAIRRCKALIPEMTVIADCCFCEYTSHGHCGVITENRDTVELDNDKTLLNLAKQAVSFAKAGADIIAPSGAIDGMVGVIRAALDEAGYTHVAIMSYSVKYASHFYGPFREAAEGAPQFGDRKSYQLDYALSAEALREADLDVNEGADFLMVKPAMPYLDIIYKIKARYPEFPLVAYQVSGEYAMIKAAAEQGWLDENAVVLESLLAIKRAGADIIITYYAKQVAKWLQ